MLIWDTGEYEVLPYSRESMPETETETESEADALMPTTIQVQEKATRSGEALREAFKNVKMRTAGIRGRPKTTS